MRRAGWRDIDFSGMLSRLCTKNIRKYKRLSFRLLTPAVLPPRLAGLRQQAVGAAGTMSLDQTLKHRKSIRDFQTKPISKGQLSYLLWASTGIQRIEDGYEFGFPQSGGPRTAPSAGALYPIETYVIANDVRKLEAGVYHYSIKAHQLEQLKQGELRQEIANAALGQGMCAAAAAVFIWSAVFERCKWKYGQRAYRYIYLDAGHIAENLALASVSINLGSCEVGALYDDLVNSILDIDGTEESVLCMAVVGAPA